MEAEVIKNIRDMDRLLRVEVKIPNDEVDRIVVNRLIGMRNSEGNKNTDTSFIDKTILCFLTEDEFQKYVIEKVPIEY